MLSQWGEGPLDPKDLTYLALSCFKHVRLKNISHFPCFAKVESRNRRNAKSFLTSAQSRGTVKYATYVKLVGRNGASRPKRFNIFNVSPGLSIIRTKKTCNISLDSRRWTHKTGERFFSFSKIA